MIGALIVIGLVFLYFVVVFLFSGVKELSNSRGNDNHPHFFEEMQSIVRTELKPLGFSEHKGPIERMRTVDFTNGNLSVKLDLDIMDSLYYLSAGTNLENGSFFKDFFLEGHLSEADKFKNDSMAQLNEWLIRNKFKERITKAV